MKIIKCNNCEFKEKYDSTLKIKGVVCPKCSERNSISIVILNSEKLRPKERELSDYEYFASNENKQWHNIKTSFSGRVKATSDIQATHKAKEKYKYVFVYRKVPKLKNGVTDE